MRKISGWVLIFAAISEILVNGSDILEWIKRIDSTIAVELSLIVVIIGSGHIYLRERYRGYKKAEKESLESGLQQWKKEINDPIKSLETEYRDLHVSVTELKDLDTKRRVEITKLREEITKELMSQIKIVDGSILSIKKDTSEQLKNWGNGISDSMTKLLGKYQGFQNAVNDLTGLDKRRGEEIDKLRMDIGKDIPDRVRIIDEKSRSLKIDFLEISKWRKEISEAIKNYEGLFNQLRSCINDLRGLDRKREEEITKLRELVGYKNGVRRHIIKPQLEKQKFRKE